MLNPGGNPPGALRDPSVAIVDSTLLLQGGDMVRRMVRVERMWDGMMVRKHKWESARAIRMFSPIGASSRLVFHLSSEARVFVCGQSSQPHLKFTSRQSSQRANSVVEMGLIAGH